MKIKRIYFNKLWSEIAEPSVSILLGARQVGKSTLMRQLELKAKEHGYKTGFYDLEQPEDLNKLAGDNQSVIRELTHKKRVVFIDEFHYLKNASKIFKAIYDSKKKVKVFASGSSSLSIHKHLKESLAGRFTKTIIYPLNLGELQQSLSFENDNYLQWGGMPGLIHAKGHDKKINLLENILSTYITKDVKGLIKEENIRAFNSLLYLLAQSQGGLSVASNLSQETGMSKPTITRYLDILCLTYVLHEVQSYSNNLANELKKSKKYYYFDIGIRNCLLKDFRPNKNRDDKGILYETAILILMQNQLKPNMEIRFWRTKKGDEVDFILLKNREPVPIDVKSKLTKIDVPNGMKKFLTKYEKSPFGIVFNEDFKTEVLFKGKKIYFKPWIEASEIDYMKRAL